MTLLGRRLNVSVPKIVSHSSLVLLSIITVLSLVQCTGENVVSVENYGSVGGQVRVAETLKAIPEASVICAGSTTQADEFGNYYLQAVPQGIQVLHVEKPGYKPYSTNILVAVADNRYDVVLGIDTVYVTLAGYTYLEGSEYPVEGMYVSCAGKSDFTDENGRFVIGGIPEGRLLLRADKDNYISYRAFINVAGNTSVRVYIPATTLAGRVDHSTDGPVAGARLQIEDWSATSDAEGYYYFDRVPRGFQTLKCTHDAYDDLQTIVDITGTDVHFDFTVRRPVVDTVFVTRDATVSRADFDACDDCPDWPKADDNLGADDKLRLEYFKSVSDTPGEPDHSAASRFFIELPSLAEILESTDLYDAQLFLYPTDETNLPGYITVHRVTGGPWSENLITWNNAPAVSVLSLTSVLMPPLGPLKIDVTSLDATGHGPFSVRFRKEEIGLANPREYIYFQSRESVQTEERPVVIVTYGF